MPELACPFQCVFCDQHRISGMEDVPEAHKVIHLIERNLSTFPDGPKTVEIAFFGGNFTGLPGNLQLIYLEIAQKFLIKGLVQGIRISTRPDYIDLEKLQLLRNYGVTTIELGAQSLDAEVLRMSGRGLGPEAVERASKLILQYGFRLGLQMMIGLPHDTFEKSYETAKRIIELGAHETRIYPCLVIKGTALEQMYLRGDYRVLTLEQAVDWSLRLWQLFAEAGVKVIRLGLHPSEGLNGDDLVAGPYHPSFKELVMTALWRDMFEKHSVWPKSDSVIIEVPADELGVAVGHKASNRNWLKKSYREVVFRGKYGQEPQSFLIKPNN